LAATGKNKDHKGNQGSVSELRANLLVSSQGAALLAATIPTLVGPARQQIKGAVLFGYTLNKKNDGRIPEYPTDRTKVFCNNGDVVCQGVLQIKTPHLLYSAAAQGEGADFLANMISH
jgi:cutinase